MRQAVNSFLKRAFDVLVSLSVLIVLSPAILAIALAVRLTSKGPVFFRDRRAGKDGAPFDMLKFRTMVDGASELGLGRVVAQDDWRITKVGQFLRRWTLDEIPQLFNVVMGDMSIVGPRAATPTQMERCTERQRRRLEVRPGMAGWAWIHGRNSLPWSERIELDVWYVDNWSFWLDMRILAKAFLVVFKRSGVYGPDGITTDLVVTTPEAEARTVIDLRDPAEEPVTAGSRARAGR
jgi:lipopolysaccharide/colanic/teichoic acid biosynthesis glycosyltransferase